MTARNTAALKTAKAEKITRCRLSSLLSTPFSIRQLSSNDVVQMEEMLTVFGNAFNEVKTYTGKPPGGAYLQQSTAARGQKLLSRGLRQAVAT